MKNPSAIENSPSHVPDLSRRRLLFAGVAAPVLAALQACGGGSESTESMREITLNVESDGLPGSTLSFSEDSLMKILSVDSPSIEVTTVAAGTSATALSATRTSDAPKNDIPTFVLKFKEKEEDGNIVLEGEDRNGKKVRVVLCHSVRPTLVAPVSVTLSGTATQVSGEFSVRPVARSASWGTLPAGFTGGAISPKAAVGNAGAKDFTFAVSVDSSIANGTYSLPVTLLGVNGKSSNVTFTVVVNRVANTVDTVPPAAPTVLSLQSIPDSTLPNALTAELQFNERVSAIELQAYIVEAAQVFSVPSTLTINPSDTTKVSIVSGNFPFAGTYTFSVRATDTSGNQSVWYPITTQSYA